MDEQSKSLFEMESTPDEDTMTILKIPTKDLKYYIPLVDKAAAAGFENTTPVLKKFYCG